MLLSFTERRRFVGAALIYLLLFLLPAAARAQERLVFQRGDALFVADADGTGARRLLGLGGKPAETLWAAAPDGRRVAWLTPLSTGVNASAAASDRSLGARPVALFIGDMTGRRSKLLMTTSDLRDRTGETVTELGASSANDATDDGRVSFENWQPVSLSWSRDARTLYLSCESVLPGSGKATFAVDALTGAAFVDAEGRWKTIADMAEVDARGTSLVGTGRERFPAQGVPGDTGVSYTPLVVVNLAEGTRTVLLQPGKITTKTLPEFAFAAAPALSPDKRQIAFVTGAGGLWVVDVQGSRHRRLRETGSRRPRWSPDGARLLFLAARLPAGDEAAAAATTAPPVYDLYEMTPDKSQDNESGTARPLLERIEFFDIVPD